MNNFLLLGLNVALTAGAQALLREGMRQVGENAAQEGTPLWSRYAEIGRNSFVVGGIGCFVISLGLWLTLLSRWRISTLYPLQQGLVFLFLELIAWRFLGESVSMGKAVGVACIGIGIYLVVRSG